MSDESTDQVHQFREGLLLNERYIVLDTLNQGSYGIVVRARDTATQSLVAIKCLTKNTTLDDDPCPFYAQELHFHQQLANFDPTLPGYNNVISCIDAFETKENAFLVLEYCDLGDLYENIMQGRIPRDTQTVKDLMVQLIDAVEYCHAAGVYHRDIKPENILMTIMDDGSGKPLLKLGDFGLATHDSWTTEIGTGSDRYMAPEQYEYRDNGYSPEKADIWAIGCCLLNLAFSRNPFKVPSTSDPIFADYVRDSMSLCDVFPTMSNDSFNIVKHALAVDPVKRDLTKVRHAVQVLENFTDSETVEDCSEVQTDFTCYADEPITCTVANRKPLRTPSLAQNTPFFSTGDGTPFSWAAALQKPISTLTEIDESESEDDDDADSDIVDTTQKFEADDGRSSDSGLGTSLGSLSITPNATPATRFTTTPAQKLNIFLPNAHAHASNASKTSRSRPIQGVAAARKIDEMAKHVSSSVPITSTRNVLGRYIQESSDRLKFGKSWSDWVEEEEDLAEELSRGDSRQSSGSSRLSFGETNDDWWDGVTAGHGWED